MPEGGAGKASRTRREAAPAAQASERERPGVRPVSARLRLFLALWPAAATAAALYARGRGLQEDCGGRLMRRDTLHLTLAFLGDVPADSVMRIEAAVSGVRAEGFAIELDCVGSWHGHRVLWTGTSRTPAALAKLADDLAGRLRAAGFSLEARGFTPHVTLVRNARRAPVTEVVAGLRWPVDSFVLVSSERLPSGAHYRVLQRWPLSSSSGGEASSEQGVNG